jgi:regulator of protease activity HflC (stomatin/prohibitin superfamily)
MNYKFSGTFILLLAGLLVLTIIFGSWYTIDQTQRGVLLRNGALVEVVQPGLHFKWPWIEAVNKVDMQTHNFTFEKVNSYSADQQPANLRISVTLHVAPDKVAEMYSRFAGDQQAAISRLITPHTLGQTKRRKHPSMSDAQTQNASAPTPPAVSGQPGSKVNVTA